MVIESTGVVEPRNRLEIKPPIAGRVEEKLRQVDGLRRHAFYQLWHEAEEQRPEPAPASAEERQRGYLAAAAFVLMFVGAAGKFLDELLAGIGMTRSQVYIANVLKCRPPGNRDPLPDEIATCTPFLAEQVHLISPSVIATLGNFATRYMLGTDRPISALRGRLFRVDGRRIVPVFHPAAALYDRTKQQVLLEDFHRIRAVLEQDEADDAGSRPAGDGTQQQLF